MRKLTSSSVNENLGISKEKLVETPGGKPKVSSNRRRDGVTISTRSPLRIVQDRDNPALTRPAEGQEIYPIKTKDG